MPDVEVFKSLGINLGGFGALAFILWQVYLKIKAQLKEDSKSDKIDQRIDQYSENLQKTIDKYVANLEALQKSNNELVLRSADLQAQLTVIHAEADSLKAEIAEHIDRIRMLEGLLRTNGISYV